MAFWLQTRLPAEDITAVGSGFLDYVKLLLVLCGILILAWVTLRYLLPRFLGMNSGSTGPIQVLARYSIEPKKTLYVIKAGQDVLLIGSSDNGLQLLKQMDPDDYISSIPQTDSSRGTGQFAKVLGTLRGRKTP